MALLGTIGQAEAGLRMWQRKLDAAEDGDDRKEVRRCRQAVKRAEEVLAKRKASKR